MSVTARQLHLGVRRAGVLRTAGTFEISFSALHAQISSASCAQNLRATWPNWKARANFSEAIDGLHVQSYLEAYTMQ